MTEKQAAKETDEVNADRARARFENGLLELTLPKPEKVKRRSVKVE